MIALSPVYTVQTECQDCYRCVRQCPVKAIKVEGGHAKVMGELCIACGRCVIRCPAHAKVYRDDTTLIDKLLAGKGKVIVSLAPSFRAEMPEYSVRELTDILKRLGFYGVSETAVGADLVSRAVAETVGRAGDGQKFFISSACPAAVEFIKRYMSEYAPYITDCASPLLAHARYLRSVYGDDTAVVFVGPCIAKKREADTWDEIAAAITFRELKAMIAKAGLDGARPAGTVDASGAFVEARALSDGDAASFIPHRAAKGELFPLEGGMIAAMKKYRPLKDVRTIAVSGIEAIRQTLEGFDPGGLERPLFLEALSCTGGCVNGPGCTSDSALAMRRVSTVDFAETAADVLSAEAASVPLEMGGTLPGGPVPENRYTEEQIRLSLRSVGKYAKSDEINCAGCGYDTCRSFAVALLDHVAEKTMCVSYMRKLAQKKANGLVKAIPSGVVIVDKHMNIIECNRNFARLMGRDIEEMFEIKPGLEGADFSEISQNCGFFQIVLSADGPEVIDREVREGKRVLHYTVFEIEKEEIAAGVIEDITTPRIRKVRTISQAQKVIDKNLAVVQKIAFLLGENAAETEAMLNSIIESYEYGEDQNDRQQP